MVAAMRCIIFCVAVTFCAVSVRAAETKLDDHEQRFEISLFAEQPQIVNPVGIQVDDRGRVFVIESHTHFRPKDYDGPKADRILLMADTDKDGRADKTSVFHEGFQHAMDLALAEDGALFVATRSSIHRLRDKDGDGQAEDVVKLITLDTKGNYPHNGLSGLAFDRKGGMYFGFGENLGEAYKLTGSDGATLTGEAEGGGVYHCQMDGMKLRRVATGFWNPFGLCVDPAGNVFATDNDPDSSPPCRLLHVVEGGDYGYEFRYGRSGLHVFQSWNGEFPGTLPMVTGTGEAPCEIVPYDGGLLVASWADNQLEHYTLVPRGASFGAERKILVSGDMSFRPVGIAVAKDGTLYVSDWASASYELPSKGRVWKLTPKGEVGSNQAGVVREPGRPLTWPDDERLVFRRLDSDDPFERSDAIRDYAYVLAEDRFFPDFELLLKRVRPNPRQLAGALVGFRRTPTPAALLTIPEVLSGDSHDAQMVVLKWIADDRLALFRDDVEEGLKRADLSRELLAAHLAALERIDRKPIGDRPNPALVLPIVKNEMAAARVRAFALTLLPANHSELTIDFLKSLLSHDAAELQLEVVRTMNESPSAERRKLLAEIAGNEQLKASVRAAAIGGLAGDGSFKGQLIKLAIEKNDALRNEALRSLVEMPLADEDFAKLASFKEIPEAARLFGEVQQTPPLDNLSAWLERTKGEGDAEAGERIFFHAKVGYCARCHRYDGRGNHVGPDLTKIGLQKNREQLLTAILQPARTWPRRIVSGRSP